MSNYTNPTVGIHTAAMSTTSQDFLIKDFLVQFSALKYFVDKSFQRNLVWSSEKQSNYIQSVADGCASSSMIVACIRSALTASNQLVESAGASFLQRLVSDGFDWLSLDGMQRRDTILKFVNSEISLNVVLKDFNGKPHNCQGRYFKDLPLAVQQSFMHNKVHVVTHMHTPYSKCPIIFRAINDGASLNHQESRTAIITPVSDKIRTMAETTYQDVWPSIESFQEKDIKRMKDSEALLHMFMELMPEIKEKDFISKDHCDNFYFHGENKHYLSNVPEYKSFAYAQDIISLAMDCFRQQRSGLKKIPKKTMWAVVYVCREIIDANLTVTNHANLFEAIRKSDNDLIADSKAQQGRDILNTQSKKQCSAEEAADFHPDNNYYWRWVNRNGAEKYRNLRVSDLIEKISKQLPLFTSSKTKAA